MFNRTPFATLALTALLCDGCSDDDGYVGWAPLPPDVAWSGQRASR